MTKHTTIDPAILYFGTPVALISTIDEDGHANLSPMSSVFWLGHTAVLGLAPGSQTVKNLQMRPECVINLPSDEQVTAVDRLALTTGSDPMPPIKLAAGYRFEADKFALAGVTPLPSELVAPPRVAECPVNLEGRVRAVLPLTERYPNGVPRIILFEVEVARVHVHESIRMAGSENRIDPEAWRPLIMSFQRFYGLGGELQASRLATIGEEWYR